MQYNLIYIVNMEIKYILNLTQLVIIIYSEY